jgi:Flp pilus assembly protein TadB
MSLPDPRHELPPRTRERSETGAQRALRRRRRRVAGQRRFDVLVGVVVGIVGVLLAPGVAMAALIAILVLLALGIYALVARRRRRRHRVRRRLPRAGNSAAR